MSKGEDELAIHLMGIKHPGMVREHVFHPIRKWRFDFAFPSIMLAVEVEGLVAPGARSRKTGKPIKSRHQTIAGFREDCHKYNEAIILGWRVLRFPTEVVMSGKALSVIERAIGCHKI